jgi:YebC/PmpR family DNA-binding regulatory protein
MSGHSKWANIKHRKGKQDALRGKIFTKMGKEIAIAAKDGADLNTNRKLADVVAKAKANNMPKDIITRAIKKGSGEMQGITYEEMTYEGYGPSGIAVIVKTLTENRNRTAAGVRHVFDKYGGGLGTLGCVSFMFDEKGLIIVEKSDKVEEEELMMLALDCGADDFAVEEDSYEIYITPENFSEVRQRLEDAGVEMATAEVTRIPQTIVEVTDEEVIKKFTKMLDMFDEDDDVQDVYHNAELPEDDEE